jgi:hypothetical protein
MGTLRALLHLTFVLCFASATHAESNESFRLVLAEKYAPIIFQKVGGQAFADAITRFDFDGDWVASNNWDNADKYNTPAYVYYDVRETHTHYFIMYALFHARDTAKVCIQWLCHENDLEGVQIVVKKDMTPHGHVVAIQALAHDKVSHYDQLSSTTSQPVVSVFSEAGGHGLFGWDPLHMKEMDILKTQNLYSKELILSLLYRYSKNWLVYSLGPTADDPLGKSHGHYNYRLLSIHDEFWTKRDSVGKGSTFLKYFNHSGVRHGLGRLPAGFAGEKFGEARARPPWAWEDKTSIAKRGDWFLDPASFTSVKQTIRLPFSFDYLHNPYLEIVGH